MKVCSFKKSLFTHNDIRLQIDEVFLNKIYGDRFTAYSAGSDPTQIESPVITVMKEAGADLGDCK